MRSLGTVIISWQNGGGLYLLVTAAGGLLSSIVMSVMESSA